MTEDKQHQLEEVTASDLLNYLSARTFNMEEEVRRNKKQMIKVKEIIRNLMLFAEMDNRDYEEAYIEAEQFLQSTCDDKPELPNVPAWIAEQMTESERAAFAKWYDKVCNEVEANKLGDTLKNG